MEILIDIMKLCAERPIVGIGLFFSLLGIIVFIPMMWSRWRMKMDLSVLSSMAKGLPSFDEYEDSDRKLAVAILKQMSGVSIEFIKNFPKLRELRDYELIILRDIET